MIRVTGVTLVQTLALKSDNYTSWNLWALSLFALETKVSTLC
jgi:hypothetical protein